jgi:purine catabolism regulator
MGVSIKEILSSEFFKEYYIISGEKGINREIQGVVLIDAPDGYKWCRGKELILTTGYFYVDNTELFKEVINFLYENGSAAIAVKTDRFLNTIAEEVTELSDKLGFPIIFVPARTAWMDIIAAVNSIAINRYISRINDTNYLEIHNHSNDYQKKISNIVKNLSLELGLSVAISDIVDKNIICYPADNNIGEKVNKTDESNLNNYQKEILCEKLNIYRIKNLDDNKSWIKMNILINNTPITQLIIWEGSDKIDYYDLFSIRVSYALFLSIYEQIYVMNSYERKFYDNLIESLINERLTSKQQIIKEIRMINNFRLNIDNSYVCLLIEQDGDNPSFYSIREKLYNTLLLKVPKDEAIFGIIDDNTLAIIKDVSKYKKDIIGNVRKEIKNLLENMRNQFDHRSLMVGIGDACDNIVSIRKSYFEALKAIEIGKYLYPKNRIFTFEELGPFGLFRVEDIQNKSYSSNFSLISPLLKDNNRDELLLTLKVFIESESNYNVTAQKLYIHNNTVRYRISKIQEICDIDLEDPIVRLKIAIMLMFTNEQTKDSNMPPTP